MAENTGNSAKTNEAFCRDKCKKDLKNLEILLREKTHLSPLPSGSLGSYGRSRFEKTAKPSQYNSIDAKRTSESKTPFTEVNKASYISNIPSTANGEKPSKTQEFSEINPADDKMSLEAIGIPLANVSIIIEPSPSQKYSFKKPSERQNENDKICFEENCSILKLILEDSYVRQILEEIETPYPTKNVPETVTMPNAVNEEIVGEQPPKAVDETIKDIAEDYKEAFDNWKCKCDNGIFALESLLRLCVENPEPFSDILKIYLQKSGMWPRPSLEDINTPITCFELSKTHGEVYGDTKYHFLMADTSTSVSKLDTMESVTVQVAEAPSGDVHNDTISENSQHLVIMREQSMEEISETEIKIEKYSSSFVSAVSEEKVKEPPKERVPTIVMEPPKLQKLVSVQVKPEKETHNSILHVPKRMSLIDEDILSDDNEDEASARSQKRTSTVSWRGITATTDDSAGSLEQVVKEATAKAENYRKNLNMARHSLIDMVKRKSVDVIRTIPDVARLVTKPAPPKRKKFSCFSCLKRKEETRKDKKQKPAPSPDESDDESKDED